MQLDEAKAVDAVSDEDVRRAEREADEAQELLTELERAAVEDPEPPSPGAVVEQEALSRFAKMRAEHTRKRAARAADASRLLALDQVGQEVTALADAAGRPNAAIVATARKLALTAATLGELCRQHDEQVAGLIARAEALNVEAPAAIGPKASSAYVALLKSAHRPDGIQAGRVRLRQVGERAREAALLAAEGDADGAVALVQSVHQQPAPVRADRYYRAPAGIVAESGPESAEMARQVKAGEIVPLFEAEVKLFLEGMLDGHPDD